MGALWEYASFILALALVCTLLRRLPLFTAFYTQPTSTLDDPGPIDGKETKRLVAIT